MNFLLDTSVISEWTKPEPNAGLVAFLAEADEDRLFLSVVTLARLRYGCERTGNEHRRRLDEWLVKDLPLRFEGRVLPIDAQVAAAWGRVMARCERSGRSLGALNAFVAATAEAHALTLVARAAADFEGVLAGDVIDPWSSKPEPS